MVSRNRPRLRELGVRLGLLEPGPLNAITDVGDVRVGHFTRRQDRLNTGVTAVLPLGRGPFTEAAEDFTGGNGNSVPGVPIDQLLDVLRRYGRDVSP